MKTIFLALHGIAILLIALSSACLNVSAAPPDIGKGKTTAFYIDHDGDGYGVGSPLGPDCDDNDPYKHVPINHADALKYIANKSGRVFYISLAGDDKTGVANDISKPYATFAGLPALKPGDNVVYRAGIYVLQAGININDYNGEINKPLVIMGYPGETVVLDRSASNNPIGGNRSSWVTFKWLICQNGASGGTFSEITYFTLEECEFRQNLTWGVKAMQGLSHFTIRKCLAHHNIAEHGLYLGARDIPNDNIIVEDSIMFKNGRHGFQHNGRVDNMIIRRNIIHSNELGGISIINGMKNSEISRNLIFNNNKQALILYVYDYSSTNQLPYSIENNVFKHNTVWIGKYNNGLGVDSPVELTGAIAFTDNVGTFEIKNTVITNNIIYTYSTVPIWFAQLKHANTTVIKNNLFYRIDNGQFFMGSEQGDGTESYMSGRPLYYWNFDKFVSLSSNFKPNFIGDPMFKNVSLDYQLNPDNFNFEPQEQSASIDKGSLIPGDLIDLKGRSLKGAPDSGVYEYKGMLPPTGLKQSK